MKKTLILLMGLLAIALVVGCSDDDDEKDIIGTEAVDFVEETVFDSTAGHFVSTLDATDSTVFAYYSFAAEGVVTKEIAKAAAPANWDIAFSRQAVKLNGGVSGAGDVAGVDLGAVDFAGVKIADTTGETWLTDSVALGIDAFPGSGYTGPPAHTILPNRYVYAMRDAGGQNYLKFRMDTLIGYLTSTDTLVGQMAEVQISYFYQSTADNFDVNGRVVVDTISVGDTTGFYDFSAGAQTYPTDPSVSADWDIWLEDFKVKQNAGDFGPGNAGSFGAWADLSDATDLSLLTTLDPTTKFLTDVPGSIAEQWYNYDQSNHTLSSKSSVYLIKSGGMVYKFMVVSYYGVSKEKITSALYTFHWVKL